MGRATHLHSLLGLLILGGHAAEGERIPGARASQESRGVHALHGAKQRLQLRKKPGEEEQERSTGGKRGS